MGSTWAAIGRARPDRDLRATLNSQLAIEQNERQNLLAQSRAALNNEQIQQMRRQTALEAERQKDLQTLIPVESFAQHFAGGVDSTNYKMGIEHATQMGWINTDATAPSISKKHAGLMQEWMQTPQIQKQIIRNRIGDINKQIAAVKGQAGEGPDGKPKELNPKQQEAVQKLEAERVRAYGVDSMVTQYYKEQAADKAAKLKEERDIEASRVEAQRRVYEEDIKAKAKLKHQEEERKHKEKLARIARSSKSDKTPTPGEALKTVASLTKAKATFDKTGKIDLMMAGLFPDMAKQQGNISKEDKETVRVAYDEAIAYYKNFTPKDGKRQSAISELKKQKKPITEANIEFIMSHIE